MMLVILVSGVFGQLSCDHCGKNITGTYVTSNGQAYHEDCYSDHIRPRCDYCKEVIDGPYNILDDKKYHPSCLTNHILPKCDICGKPLEGSYQSDYWGNDYHIEHTHELPECSVCGRLICEQLTEGGFKLGDARAICSICNETAVTDNYSIESSMDNVLRLFTSNGITGFPNDIPISLVDKPTLKRLSQTYSENMQGFTDQNAQTRNGSVISRKSHIYILSHLPRIMFQAVLAHELLHVYLFEHDLDLRSDIREGFCNLGSEMVYKNTRSEFAKFRLQNMQASQDPDYGVGYRNMSELLYKKGWSYILENIGDIR